MNLYRTKLSEKLKESLEAVVPIIAIVLILSFTIAPVPPGILMAFIIGAILLVVGMMFFTLGAEMSMTPMGERIGTRIAQSKRLPVIIGLCFILGFIITISEPDLQVLAGQVPSVSNMTLILAVAVGVGIFLVAAVLRMLFSKPLSYMLLIFYPVVFILTFFVSKNFLAIAFDSGGVTTGPMTVRDCNTGCRDICSIVEIIRVRNPTLYEGNRWLTASNHSVLHILSGGIPEIKKENADQNFGRYPVYIHWTGIIPDRGKCRIYAGR